MKLIEQFTRNRTVLSFEIYPPKADVFSKKVDEIIEPLALLMPDFISVTCGAGGGENCSKTIALAKRIKEEYGIEPLVHFPAGCYNYHDVDAFTQELSASNIENVLVLRGDRHEQFVPCHETGLSKKKGQPLEQVGVFAHASDLAEYLKEKTDFCLAGACYPEGHPESVNELADFNALKKKVNAGTSFLISQLFFDNSHFWKIQESCRKDGINVPICAGIFPAVNERGIEKVTALSKITLPLEVKALLTAHKNDPEVLREEGIKYTVAQCAALIAGGVNGIHLYTMNHPDITERIVNELRQHIN